MANPGFIFLHINICGLSDHSKIALNQYLQQTKADIVSLNEPRHKLAQIYLTVLQQSVVKVEILGVSQFY